MITITHANLDTGYTLTEVLSYNITFYEDSDRTVGLVWHLRDADGKMQVVQAGQLIFDERRHEARCGLPCARRQSGLVLAGSGPGLAIPLPVAAQPVRTDRGCGKHVA